MREWPSFRGGGACRDEACGPRFWAGACGTCAGVGRAGEPRSEMSRAGCRGRGLAQEAAMQQWQQRRRGSNAGGSATPAPARLLRQRQHRGGGGQERVAAGGVRRLPLHRHQDVIPAPGLAAAVRQRGKRVGHPRPGRLVVGLQRVVVAVKRGPDHDLGRAQVARPRARVERERERVVAQRGVGVGERAGAEAGREAERDTAGGEARGVERGEDLWGGGGGPGGGGRGPR